MCEVQLRVKWSVPVYEGQAVFVVGSVEELGSWNPGAAKQLTHTSDDEWCVTFQLLTKADDVKYRYFVGFLPEGCDTPVVDLWETNRQPRVLTEPWTSADDVFGFYGGGNSVSRGWLTVQTEVHLQLHPGAISLWGQEKTDYQVSCRVFSAKGGVCKGRDGQVFVSVLGDEDLGSGCLPQPESGVRYRSDNFVTFKTQTLKCSDKVYRLGVTSIPNTDNTFFHADICLPSETSRSSVGQVTVAICDDKGQPIGQLRARYLVVEPMPGQHCSMEVSYSRHWKKQRRPLDVGHRGMGNSHKDDGPARVCENTMASFSQAGEHGADFIEFDVVLTKDKVPVIYHDFSACIAPKKLNGGTDWLKTPIHELTYEELQQWQVEHSSVLRSSANNTASIPEVSSDERSFPKLSTCFDDMPSSNAMLAYDIEIKYPQEKITGSLEGDLPCYMDRNEYLDVILDTVFKHSGQRRILFSCFDADVCTMLNLKQNKYPVLFLTQGPTEKYTPFSDIRAQTSEAAIFFARMEQFLGINFHTEDLLKKPELVNMAKTRELVVWCWGEDNNDRHIISTLKSAGIDGVTYDRIYELKENKMNVFKEEALAKEQYMDFGQPL